MLEGHKQELEPKWHKIITEIPSKPEEKKNNTNFPI